ncbi:MAG: MFS transporter, partial [Pseudomonadota bacterium]
AGAAMAAALVAFSMSNGRWPDYLVAFVAGASWLAALSNLSVSAQLALPEWVRARGLAIFLMIFYGALAFGGVMWGVVASEIGLGPALAMAGVGAGLAAAVGERWRLGQGEALDLTPSMHWPKPATATRVDPDRGPVMITVTYRVPGANRQRFLALMGELRLERLRNGALTWGVFEDVGRPGLFVETYTEASWIEHLRHHERVTQADRALQDRVRALVESLEVRHHVAPPAGSYEA